MTRAERAAEAAQLKAAGVPWREACERMGVSRSYYFELLKDPDGEAVRARKDSYRGACEECGAATDGSNGRNAPKLCRSCNGRKWGGLNQRWTAYLILNRIRDWRAIYGEPPAGADWCPTIARRLHDEPRAKRYEDADGHWPHMTIVVKVFGSWNAAIETAGFEPRAVGGGNGNQLRKRSAA